MFQRMLRLETTAGRPHQLWDGFPWSSSLCPYAIYYLDAMLMHSPGRSPAPQTHLPHLSEGGEKHLPSGYSLRYSEYTTHTRSMAYEHLVDYATDVENKLYAASQYSTFVLWYF